MSRLHWVLLETGANQSYVFASTRRRLNVGASELLSRLGGRWLDRALDELDTKRVEVSVVVRASGVVRLLVADPEVGRRLVSSVTRQALEEAPGLEVWGTVTGPVTLEDGLGAEGVGGLLTAIRAHAGHRWRRPSAQARHLATPFSQACDAGLGAAARTVRVRDEVRHLSARAAACSDAAGDGLGRIRALFAKGNDGAGGDVVPSAGSLDQDHPNDGWVAIVHADGNGLGRVFQQLGSLEVDADLVHVDEEARLGADGPGWRYIRLLHAFSRQLDDLAVRALRTAAQTTRALAPAAGQSGWLLPLVVGGDDLTVVVDGRVAFDFTLAYLTAFEDISRDDPLLGAIAGAAGLGTGLTASAGIAWVKPHFPFDQAYRLAEELTSEAKTASSSGQRSTLDLHVLHDSAGAPLSQLRRHLTLPSRDGTVHNLWAGPVLLRRAEDDAALDAASLRRLAVGLARTEEDAPPLRSTSAHALRAAILRGPDEGSARAEALVKRYESSPDPALKAAAAPLAEQLEQLLTPRGGSRHVPYLSALSLASVSQFVPAATASREGLPG